MRRPKVFLALVTLVAPVAAGEPDKGSERTTLDEIVVTATRTDLRLFDTPYMAERIENGYIQGRRMAKTMTEIFAETPSIGPQKTSAGQGSPYLRGLTGFRTLLLIDGIRLNNSVFRDGPNQYWNTIDPFSIGRLEIVKGPSSVLYGSDAIGGTVNALTRGAELAPGAFNCHGRIVTRYSSADDSLIGRVEASGNVGQKLGFIAGMTLMNYGDIEAGGDTGRQPKTGFDQRACDLKLDYYPTPDSKLTFGHQCFRQDDAWRAHATIFATPWHGTVAGTDRVRVFDQRRELTYVQYEVKNLRSFIDAARLSLSWQRQEETEDRVRSNLQRNLQGFTCDTLGLSAQFECNSPIDRLTYGGEVYHDLVTSFRRDYKADGSLSKVRIQGPVADDARYDLLGLYIQDQIPVTEHLDATLGVRWTYARAEADDVEDPTTGREITVRDSWSNLSASARLLYHLDEHWNLFGGISQGFRAPNLSDLTRFDISRSGELETPSPNLKPEKYLSCEIGAKANYGRWNGQIAFFHTRIRDMIDRYPTGRVISGGLEVQKANIGDGHMCGIELQGEYRLTRQWTLFGGVACVRGEADTYPTSAMIKARRPMSKVPPPTAVLGARWQHESGRFWLEALTRMAAKQDRLSPSDERDTQRIPPGGTPGYAVLTLRGGVQATKNLKLNAAIENVLDKDYRIHGSGQNEPGRNFVLSADWTF
ncbi:MAG: TonB-dependent receptor [Planctomycetes bacterium]|nr:TonB-dependent receptor [Planctomycetota bacterium]